MFDTISRLFSTRADTQPPVMEPKLAVAALLVHLAAVDGQVTTAERDALRGGLIDTYDLSEAEVERLIEEAHQRDSRSVDFYRFTSALANLPNEEKLEIIRLMWQVVLLTRPTTSSRTTWSGAWPN